MKPDVHQPNGDTRVDYRMGVVFGHERNKALILHNVGRR